MRLSKVVKRVITGPIHAAYLFIYHYILILYFTS